jgi:ABC-2 type transport system permease protein
MIQWRRLKALIIKEILAVWQDKKSRTMLILPPMMQLLIFSWAATLDVTNVTVAYVNQDAGRWGEELMSRFKGSPVFSHVERLESPLQIADVIDRQKAVMVLSLDKLFSQKIVNGNPVSVQLILDGRKSNTAQIVQGYAARIIQSFSGEMERLYGREPLDTQIVPRNWFNPNLIYTWFTVTGLVAILSTLISVAITSLSIARERETGTFEQLLVSPLTRLEILIGKSIPAVIIGMVEGTVILIAALTIFHVPFVGSPLLLYISMFVFIVSLVGLGLFISSLCQTQQQAILGVFVFLAPAVILSGYATPIDNMPPWLQKITLLNPLRYFIYIVRGLMLRGIGWELVLQNLWPMLLIAFFTLTAAEKLFRKRIE